MENMTRKKLSGLFLAMAIFLSGLMIVQTVHGGTTVSSAVTIGASAPSVSGVTINGTNPASITLTANTTTSVTVGVTIYSANGCSSVTNGTTTVLFYRSGFTSSTCLTGGTTSLDCYVATAFTASSSCSNGIVNATTTFGVQYFARATDASSSFPNQNWMGTVIFKDAGNATGTADSTAATSTNDIATLTALDVTTSSLNYGILTASSTTGSTNQNASTTNAGNSSTTLQLSAVSTLTSGANSIATSSQGYSSTTFTYPGTSIALTASPVTLGGYQLTAPTSTAYVSRQTFWGLGVPNGTPSGTYAGTNQFTALFVP